MRINTNGVGIGTATPADPLSVNGNTSVTGTVTVTDTLCEQSFKDGLTQAFTGAGGFQAITNFEANVTDASYSVTHSNITVTSAGRYTVSLDLSFQTATASELECRLTTNEVAVTDVGGNMIGWKRTQGASTSDGVVAASKTLSLSANTRLGWVLDATADETATWNYGTFRVERR